MSRSWQDEYLSALEARDVHEKANEEIINAYTQLADEYAALHKSRSSAQDAPPAPQDSAPSRSGTPSKISRVPPSILGSATVRSPSPASPSKGDSDPRLRADLTAANRTVLDLNNQILALRSEIEAFRADVDRRDARTSELDGAIAKLQAEKLALGRKLRDRESEWREKDRLVGEVQDENLSLEMQLNVSDERAQKLERENRELVDRWMRRVGREADAMNEGSGWR